MRAFLVLTTLLACTSDAGAAGLRIRFGDASAGPDGDAWIDLGSISGRSCGFRDGDRCLRSSITRRRITVRVERGAGGMAFARLSASLVADDARARVRIDGVLLSAAPRLVDAGAPLGVAVAHTIEIEVPSTEPAGRVAAAITWHAEVDR
jgi:hypothetical protein